MAAKWSDYRNTVYGYLKNYRHFKGQTVNLELAIQGIRDELKNLYGANLTVKYGEHTPGGYSELSAMEKVVVRKQLLEAKLSVLLADSQRIENLIHRIDSALRFLGDIEQKIVRMKFIERQKWYAIAMATGYSERRCQDISNRSVDEITGILFPESMTGQQRLNFVFLESNQTSEELPTGVENSVDKSVDN